MQIMVLSHEQLHKLQAILVSGVDLSMMTRAYLHRISTGDGVAAPSRCFAAPVHKMRNSPQLGITAVKSSLAS
jgi:hypothetical protein